MKIGVALPTLVVLIAHLIRELIYFFTKVCKVRAKKNITNHPIDLLLKKDKNSAMVKYDLISDHLTKKEPNKG